MSRVNIPTETGPKKPVDAEPIQEGTHRWVAIFEQRDALEATLHELNEAGFDENELSVLMQPVVREAWEKGPATAVPPMPLAAPLSGAPIEQTQWQNASVAPDKFQQHQTVDVVEPEEFEKALPDDVHVSVKSADALKTNTVAGAIMGMIAGAAATLIPGIGPVLGVGAVASGLGALTAGAAAGSVAGGLVGYFNDMGLPREHAETYEKALKEGKALLFVEAHYETEGTERNRLGAAQRILRAHQPEALFQES